MRCVIGIRANAGPTIGFGHLRRCLSLAESLIVSGAGVVLLVNPESDPPSWISRCPNARVEIVPAEEARTLDCTREQLHSGGINALIVDSYDAGEAALAEIRVPVVVIVDAPPIAPLPAAIIVNASADAAAHYHPLAHGSRALLGPKYVPLRQEFAACPARQIRAHVEKVLVTAGGGDESGMSLVLLSAVTATPCRSVSVVTGPYFPRRVVRALETESRGDARVHIVHAPESLRHLMLDADVAITTGGQTTYELAATGTPAIAVRVAANQTPNLSGLAAAGTLEWVGDADDPSVPHCLETAFRALADDSERRRTMSQKGREVVDGCGSTRVAEEVLRLCA